MAEKKSIKVMPDFYLWILHKKQGTEKSVEDTLRRLLGYKKRERAKKK